MSAIGDIYVGLTGSEFLLHRAGLQVRETDNEIIVESRMSDGTLVSDLKAVKKHFELSYSSGIEEDDMNAVLALYVLHGELNFKITRKDLSIDQYTVVLRPFSRTRALVRDIVLWNGVTMVFDEV